MQEEDVAEVGAAAVDVALWLGAVSAVASLVKVTVML